MLASEKIIGFSDLLHLRFGKNPSISDRYGQKTVSFFVSMLKSGCSGKLYGIKMPWFYRLLSSCKLPLAGLVLLSLFFAVSQAASKARLLLYLQLRKA
ncbi:MAG: hypothetical protein U5L02_16800 [Rheinheimera sp.]|nr:hypothetical protein [Rheinheimera sp.]